MSQEQDVQKLLREGIEAARAGNKAAARELFEQVVELDENSERGWYWLASVVETDEERRVCLSNVLVINPNNEKARNLMDKLEAKKREEEADEEIIPGVSRRQLFLIVGGGGALIAVLVLIVVAIIVVNNNRQQAQIAEQTQVAVAFTATWHVLETATSVAEETRIAALEPTPTTLLVGTLPPTFTPTATEAPEEAELELPPPPAGIGGTLAVWGGRDSLGLGGRALEIYTIPLSTRERNRVGNQYGREVRFTDSPGRIIYTRYFQPTFSYGIESINTNGTQSLITQDNEVALSLGQPDRCQVRGLVAFTGFPQRELTVETIMVEPAQQIFILERETEIIRPLTTDEATYNNPAFSPDCSRVAAVRDDTNSPSPGPDVVLIDLNTSSISPVTTDLTTFIEANPRWSPDGRQIVFSAAPANDPNNSDIFVVNADGSGVPLPIARSPADDILPVFSPDGQYIAFSSNRNAARVYNIYVVNLADNSLFQVTNSTTEGNFFVGDWR